LLRFTSTVYLKLTGQSIERIELQKPSRYVGVNETLPTFG
jgi:hypothetical protein